MKSSGHNKEARVSRRSKTIIGWLWSERSHSICVHWSTCSRFSEETVSVCPSNGNVYGPLNRQGVQQLALFRLVLVSPIPNVCLSLFLAEAFDYMLSELLHRDGAVQ